MVQIITGDYQYMTNQNYVQNMTNIKHKSVQGTKTLKLIDLEDGAGSNVITTFFYLLYGAG